MPRRSPFVIELSNEERVELEARVKEYTSPYRDVMRAKIVLLASEGLGNDRIAARLSMPRQIVSKWRQRYSHGESRSMAFYFMVASIHSPVAALDPRSEPVA